MPRPPTPLNTPTYLRLRNQIREDIEAGQWRLGQHLTLGELSSHYNVSNVPVREALLQLQGEGLVDMRMNRGAVVLKVDSRYIDNFHDIRAQLESMLAMRACALRTPRQLARAQTLLQEFEAAAGQSSASALCAADTALHDHINQIARNDHAVAMLASRSPLLDAFRRTRESVAPEDVAQWLHHNRRLVHALQAQDAVEAAQAVRDHVEVLRAYLLKMLEEPADEEASGENTTHQDDHGRDPLAER